MLNYGAFRPKEKVSNAMEALSRTAIYWRHRLGARTTAFEGVQAAVFRRAPIKNVSVLTACYTRQGKKPRT